MTQKELTEASFVELLKMAYLCAAVLWDRGGKGRSRELVQMTQEIAKRANVTLTAQEAQKIVNDF